VPETGVLQIGSKGDPPDLQPQETLMTDHLTPAPSEQSEQSPPARRRGPLFIAVIAIVAALTGALATTAAISQGFGPGFGGGFGRGFGHGHWGHGALMGLGQSFVEERADRGVRHLAIEIDATAEQEAKLRAIVKAAVKDLFPMHEKLHAARERAQSLLTQQTVDRAAIEAFRAEQIALADNVSKRIAQAVADAAEALTPEQRQKIRAHLESRRGFGPPWRRG
jgi:Spy/CpxP family protein refolding chaperone